MSLPSVTADYKEENTNQSNKGTTPPPPNERSLLAIQQEQARNFEEWLQGPEWAELENEFVEGK